MQYMFATPHSINSNPQHHMLSTDMCILSPTCHAMHDRSFAHTKKLELHTSLAYKQLPHSRVVFPWFLPVHYFHRVLGMFAGPWVFC